MTSGQQKQARIYASSPRFRWQAGMAIATAFGETLRVLVPPSDQDPLRGTVWGERMGIQPYTFGPASCGGPLPDLFDPVTIAWIQTQCA